MSRDLYNVARHDGPNTNSKEVKYHHELDMNQYVTII